MSVFKDDSWLKVDAHKKLKEKGGLIEGEYGGLGWTLIKKCVFEKLKDPCLKNSKIIGWIRKLEKLQEKTLCF